MENFNTASIKDTIEEIIINPRYNSLKIKKKTNLILLVLDFIFLFPFFEIISLLKEPLMFY